MFGVTVLVSINVSCWSCPAPVTRACPSVESVTSCLIVRSQPEHMDCALGQGQAGSVLAERAWKKFTEKVNKVKSNAEMVERLESLPCGKVLLVAAQTRSFSEPCPPLLEIHTDTGSSPVT